MVQGAATLTSAKKKEKQMKLEVMQNKIYTLKEDVEKLNLALTEYSTGVVRMNMMGTVLSTELVSFWRNEHDSDVCPAIVDMFCQAHENLNKFGLDVFHAKFNDKITDLCLDWIEDTERVARELERAKTVGLSLQTCQQHMDQLLFDKAEAMAQAQGKKATSKALEKAWPKHKEEALEKSKEVMRVQSQEYYGRLHDARKSGRKLLAHRDKTFSQIFVNLFRFQDKFFKAANGLSEEFTAKSHDLHLLTREEKARKPTYTLYSSPAHAGEDDEDEEEWCIDVNQLVPPRNKELSSTGKKRNGHLLDGEVTDEAAQTAIMEVCKQLSEAEQSNAQLLQRIQALEDASRTATSAELLQLQAEAERLLKSTAAAVVTSPPPAPPMVGVPPPPPPPGGPPPPPGPPGPPGAPGAPGVRPSLAAMIEKEAKTLGLPVIKSFKPKVSAKLTLLRNNHHLKYHPTIPSSM
jgi:hypothetical protein